MCAMTVRSAAEFQPRCSMPPGIAGAEHPARHLACYTGILQADAYGGYDHLYEADRPPGPIRQALCWSHARRKFFELADIAASRRRGKASPPVGGEARRRHRSRRWRWKR
jgi:hypothetical protein